MSGTPPLLSGFGLRSGVPDLTGPWNGVADPLASSPQIATSLIHNPFVYQVSAWPADGGGGGGVAPWVASAGLYFDNQPTFGPYWRNPVARGSVFGVSTMDYNGDGTPPGFTTAVAGAAIPLSNMFNSWTRITMERRYGAPAPAAAAAATPPQAAAAPAPAVVPPLAERTEVYFKAAQEKADDSSKPGSGGVYPKPVQDELAKGEAGNKELAGREAGLRGLADGIAGWMRGTNADERRGAFLDADKDVGDDPKKMLLNLISPGETTAGADFAKAVQPLLGSAWAPHGDDANKPEPYLEAMLKMLGAQWGADAPKMIRKLYALALAEAKRLGVKQEEPLPKADVTQKLQAAGYNKPGEAEALVATVFTQLKTPRERRRVLEQLEKAATDAKEKINPERERMIRAASVIMEALGITEKRVDKGDIDKLLNAAMPVKKVGRKLSIDTGKGLDVVARRLTELFAALKQDGEAEGTQWQALVKRYRKEDKVK